MTPHSGSSPSPPPGPSLRTWRPRLRASLAAIFAVLSLKRLFTGTTPKQPSTMTSQDEAAILARLSETSSLIESIRAITGNPGVSVGVLHHGKPIYAANYGYRDVATKTPPDSDTIFPVGSLTKAMVATLFAALVEEGKVSFETKLSDLVPEYNQPSEDLRCKELATEANLIDLLAHRLGITMGNNFWSQKSQQVLVDKAETAKIVGFLQPLVPFRSKFMYSNWGYGLAGEILEDVARTDLQSLADQVLFKPLGMNRTTMGDAFGENVAKSYMALSNATPFEIPTTAYVAGKARAGAGACKSTVNNLLRFYGAWMAAAKDQDASGKTHTPGSPFKHTAVQWTKHSTITDGSDYGFGWVLAQLPGKGGLVGVNGYESPELPIIAKGTTPRRLVYHQGSVCGALSAVYLLPETESAVVVLGNGFDLCDTPDWIAQLLLEALLDAPERNDYVDLAKRASANALSHHQPTVDQLAAEQEHDTPVQPLEQYTGKYFNKAGNFFLEVAVSSDGTGLVLIPQGFLNTAYNLHHYHHDVFAWDCDRDAESKEALYPQFAIGLHRVLFQTDDSGKVVSLNWQIDKAIPEGEVFTKRDP
ncbi:beta-lactamase/transpeptidase-like protein [Echria macrotheca]|uniref:Beta-lactamase/transpeptidase-like protein n=1 Tax=Echria macrotheca TaxID=438768 RepID=A0AAJ0B2F1_9PEZI|nr:beta-lactamase/transpeptidase-like protein [Echria macrotheca]